MQNVWPIGISSVQHFLIDGMCICSMFLIVGIYGNTFGSYGDRMGMGAILLYNVLAFMSQPLSGLLADRMGRRHWLLMWSALLMTLAVALASLIPILVVSSLTLMEQGLAECLIISVAVLLGTGNSLFHVWGGKQAVVKTGNDIRALGVFVSTGVMGLAVGLVFRSWPLLYGLLLLYVGLAIAYVYHDDGLAKPVSDIRLRSNWFTPVRIWTLVVALMLFVCYRSFANELFSGGISKTEELILWIAVSSMLGKMAGGWIARYIGILWSMMVILAGVALCFLFRGEYEGVLLLGVFLMNCTMPITLYLANVLLPRREGMAFGLLAAALLPGYLLAVYM